MYLKKIVKLPIIGTRIDPEPAERKEALRMLYIERKPLFYEVDTVVELGNKGYDEVGSKTSSKIAFLARAASASCSNPIVSPIN